jgi:hypothetical protein
MTLFSWLSANQQHGTGSEPTGEGSVSSGFEEAGRQQIQRAAELFKTTINTYPAATLGVALASGVLLGWLIKRR